MGRVSVHLIISEDSFLAERRCQDILDRTGELSSVDTLETATLTGADVLAAVAPSLFATARGVVFAHGEDAKKEVMEAFEEIAQTVTEEVTVIIRHTGGGRMKRMVPALKKLCDVHEVAVVKPSERLRWVNQEFSRHGVRVTPDVAQAVLEGVGSDLRELASAIAQLVADNEGAVTVESVRALYEGVAEVSGFDIADLACTGQLSRAVASTRRALQLGEPPVRLASALAANVAGIACLYAHRGTLTQVSLPGTPPWKVDRIAKMARRWDGPSVSRACIIIADLEDALKGGGGNVDYAIESAVAELARLSG
ncbi:MAG: DNA polymerase III subunit delta [Corynebacterium sp.]|nr:DNA polymerase III subunit delta [Corynebacterium sp.]